MTETKILPIYDLIDATEWNYGQVVQNPSSYSREFLRYSREILSLMLSDARINWSSTYTAPIPGVDFNHPIIVGGTWFELCVENRANGLLSLGFTNVQVDRNLSASLREHRKG